MNGKVVEWNDAIGQGMADGESGAFAFTGESCSARLQARLEGHTIPPGQPVPVTFDVDPVAGEAVNVDLAEAVAARAIPRKAARKAPAKRAPAGRRKPSSAKKPGAKRATRKAPTRKSPPRRGGSRKPRNR